MQSIWHFTLKEGWAAQQPKQGYRVIDNNCKVINRYKSIYHRGVPQQAWNFSYAADEILRNLKECYIQDSAFDLSLQGSTEESYS